MDKNSFHKVTGYLYKPEGELLQNYAEGVDVLEVGSFRGRSAVAMGAVAKSVTCVDPFISAHLKYKGSQVFFNNVKKHGMVPPFLTVYERMFEDVSEQLDLTKYGFFFYDGDHDYIPTLHGLKAFESCGVPIGMHDYKPNIAKRRDTVCKATDEFCSEYGWSITDQAGSLVILTKDKDDGTTTTS